MGKKIKKVSCLLSLLLAVLLVFSGCDYILDFLNSDLNKDQTSEIDVLEGNLTKQDVKTIGDSEFSVHFLEVGNEFTGDCTYIKAGKNDILIDAGSRKNSAQTIIGYVDQFCDDNTLEYVIATHAHQDHIAGFVGPSKEGGIFDHYQVNTVIDYALTNATSSIKTQYESKRDAEPNCKHYTALQCYKQQNGAKRSYKITDDLTMTILYQNYYEEKSSDENNYSVCLLFTYKDINYLFTGDLEKEGEASLVESNKLPKCKLFKGGHHGSPTSNTLSLLNKIKPEIVCVCCCCGSDEYTSNIANMFPSQQFVDNVSQFTDNIYVTTIIDEAKGFTSMNGNIILYIDNEDKFNIRCTNNSTKFKDTEWFKKNRIMKSVN